MSARKQNETTFKEEYLHYKYYVHFGGKSLGPFRLDELRKLQGFTLQTPMRRTVADDWKPAFTVMNMKAYFSSANDAKAWSKVAAQMDREKARRARKARRSGVKTIFRVFTFLIVAAAGALFYLQASGRLTDKSLSQRLMLRLPLSIRALIPYTHHKHP